MTTSRLLSACGRQNPVSMLSGEPPAPRHPPRTSGTGSAGSSHRCGRSRSADRSRSPRCRGRRPCRSLPAPDHPGEREQRRVEAVRDLVRHCGQPFDRAVDDRTMSTTSANTTSRPSRATPQASSTAKVNDTTCGAAQWGRIPRSAACPGRGRVPSSCTPSHRSYPRLRPGIESIGPRGIRGRKSIRARGLSCSTGIRALLRPDCTVRFSRARITRVPIPRPCSTSCTDSIKISPDPGSGRKSTAPNPASRPLSRAATTSPTSPVYEACTAAPRRAGARAAGPFEVGQIARLKIANGQPHLHEDHVTVSR